MKLPGQSRQASSRLNAAVAVVREGLGRNIVFLPLTQHPEPRLGQTVGGYHDSLNSDERVWLDAGLPYVAGEATAAHELAHIVQMKERYPHASSIRCADGRPLIPALEHLVARANNLVMDESADLWAISRGFNMGKALGNIGLDQLIEGLNHKAIVAEASDWKAYYSGLEKLAKERLPKKPCTRIGIGLEAETQVMALDYAGLSLRLDRYGLFGGLEPVWAEHWPVSRGIGKELGVIVRLNGVENRDKCLQALEKIVAFLRIPAPLINIG